MNNILYNLTHTPTQYRKGQVWRLFEHDIDVIITDATFASLGAVRTMVVSLYTSITDDRDVLITKTASKGIFAAKRVAIRATAGPLPVSSLKYFLGTLSDSVTKKVIESEKNTDFGYYPEQLQDIGIINSLLEPLRFRAVALLEDQEKYSLDEESLRSPLILLLPRNTNGVEYQPVKIAASDNKVKTESAMFWTKEREQRKNSITLINQPHIIIRLSVIDGFMYFVIISDKVKTIDNILLKNEETEVYSTEQEISPGKEKRAFTRFNRELLKHGLWKISYNVDGIKREHEVMLEWMSN